MLAKFFLFAIAIKFHQVEHGIIRVTRFGLTSQLQYNRCFGLRLLTTSILKRLQVLWYVRWWLRLEPSHLVQKRVASFVRGGNTGPDKELELKHGEANLNFEVKEVIILEYLSNQISALRLFDNGFDFIHNATLDYLTLRWRQALINRHVEVRKLKSRCTIVDHKLSLFVVELCDVQWRSFLTHHLDATQTQVFEFIVQEFCWFVE